MLNRENDMGSPPFLEDMPIFVGCFYKPFSVLGFELVTSSMNYVCHISNTCTLDSSSGILWTFLKESCFSEQLFYYRFVKNAANQQPNSQTKGYRHDDLENMPKMEHDTQRTDKTLKNTSFINEDLNKTGENCPNVNK